MRKGVSALIAVVTAAWLWPDNATDAAESRAAPSQRRLHPPEEPAEAREVAMAEVDAWLRRLPGRYRADADTSGERLADCRNVGDGPGVHCIVGPLEGAEKPYPTVMLLGVAAEIPGVRNLRVNESSLAETGQGTLAGDTLRLGNGTRCPVSIDPFTRAFIVRCETSLRIHAPPHGRSFSMFYVTDVTLRLPGGRSRTDTLTRESRFERINDRGSRRD